MTSPSVLALPSATVPVFVIVKSGFRSISIDAVSTCVDVRVHPGSCDFLTKLSEHQSD